MKRYLTWYVEATSGDLTSQGPVYCLDDDYDPFTVRAHIKGKPATADEFRYDIKCDGVSIFTVKPIIAKGVTSEEVTEGFVQGMTLDKYSYVTLDLTDPNGATGITITLELTSVSEDSAAGSDT